jgi:hypothetical protein
MAEVHPAGQAMPTNARREVADAEKTKPAPRGLLTPYRPDEGGPDAMAPEMITNLQRLAGNRAVTALLHSASDKPAALRDYSLPTDSEAHAGSGPLLAD